MFRSLKAPIGIISSGNSATLAYWFSSCQNNPDFTFLSNDYLSNLDKFNTIIIVRYLPLRFLYDIQLLKKKGIKIVLFIDDNLFSNIFSFNLPFIYKFRLWYKIYRFKNSIHKYITDIWVTNHNLLSETKKCLNKNPINIEVLSSDHLSNLSFRKKIFNLYYFGSSSHIQELDWLVSLFKELQLYRNDCLIHIILNKKWVHKFSKIPRIIIYQPMAWETFFMDSCNKNIDIALVPNFSSRFNDCRSPTKFFDIIRMKAVGIYSCTPPYLGFIRNRIDGYLLPNNIECWIEKINHLLDDEQQRKFIVDNAEKRITLNL